MCSLSIKKCCLLISLVLFYPKIVTSKTLDINYDNTSDLALSPRSALQLNACHTKADPMLINVNFEPMLIGNNFTATLTINGDNYTKNYVALNSSSGMTKSVGVDSDFQIPWQVLVNGIGAGSQGYEVQKPEKTEIHYTDAFCFDRKYNQIGTGAKDAWPSGGFIPIFIAPPFRYDDGRGHRVSSHPASTCDIPERPEDQVEATYWPDYYNPPDYIQNNREPDFLFKHRFHRTKNITIIPSSGSETNFKPFNINVMNKYENKNFVYRFPFGEENNKGVRIDNGGFSFKLSNRNISSLTLTISSDGVSEVWSWSIEKGDHFKNTLHLKHSQAMAFSPLGSDKNDMYSIKSFYKDENNFYKGTLADKTSLTQNYFDYISKDKPLSLPSDSQGDINLLSTDSLTLTIGQKPNMSGVYNSLTFRAYGNPLKFAPLIQNGNEIVSAMQFRNACY